MLFLGFILHRYGAGFGHVKLLDQERIGALLHRFLDQLVLHRVIAHDVVSLGADLAYDLVGAGQVPWTEEDVDVLRRRIGFAQVVCRGTACKQGEQREEEYLQRHRYAVILHWVI
jgi:hypothetical protein